MALNRTELIDAVLQEMERVWGAEGFGGEPIEYVWLESQYHVSEEEDVQWQLILEYAIGEPDLLRKYRSGVEAYPGSK